MPIVMVMSLGSGAAAPSRSSSTSPVPKPPITQACPFLPSDHWKYGWKAVRSVVTVPLPEAAPALPASVP